MIYLVELTGYNPVTAALDYVRAATTGYVSRPTDEPANAVWDDILNSTLSVETSLFQSGTTGGASATSAGDIELVNDKGALDHLLEWDWAGHPVRVWSLPTAGSPFSAATLIFKGELVQPEFDLETVRFTLCDRTSDLETPICTERYAGDNVPPHGKEGDVELAGVIKPRAFGICRNVTPKMANPQKIVMQVNDGPVSAIPMVYDGGASFGVNQLSNAEFDDVGAWQLHNAEIAEGIGKLYAYANPGIGPVTYDYGRLDLPVNVVSGGTYRLAVSVLSLAVGIDPRVDVVLSGPDGQQIVASSFGAPEDIDITFTAAHDHSTISFQAAGRVAGGLVATIDDAWVSPESVDYPDLDALEAAVIPAGAYATCLAEGLFRLATDASGEVTATVVALGSAVAADIALALAREGFDDADLDLAAFAALQALTDAEIGLFVDDETTIAAGLDQVLGSIGAWWTMTPQDVLTCGRFDAPTGTPAAEIVVDADVLESGGIERVATADDGSGVPTCKVTLGYQRNWCVQTSDLLGPSTYMDQAVFGYVDNVRRTWLNAELRTVVAEDGALKERLPGAVEATVDTLLDVKAVAEAEAARLLAIYHVRRDRYRLRLPRRYFGHLVLGDVVRLVWDRFGLAEGRLFLVIGLTVDVAGDSDYVDLDIWG